MKMNSRSTGQSANHTKTFITTSQVYSAKPTNKPTLALLLKFFFSQRSAWQYPFLIIPFLQEYTSHCTLSKHMLGHTEEAGQWLCPTLGLWCSPQSGLLSHLLPPSLPGLLFYFKSHFHVNPIKTWKSIFSLGNLFFDVETANSGITDCIKEMALRRIVRDKMYYFKGYIQSNVLEWSWGDNGEYSLLSLKGEAFVSLEPVEDTTTIWYSAVIGRECGTQI